MPFFDDRDDEGDRYSHNSGVSWRNHPANRCNAKVPMSGHLEVTMQVYNTSGSLIGPHLRCAVCNSVWYQFANPEDLPDPHTLHSK